MDVKDAVRIAKSYLSELLAEEKMQNLGLEEVEFDDRDRVWSITLGFSRPWDRKLPRSALEAALPYSRPSDDLPRREYRVINISDKDEKVVSVKLHEIVH